MSSNTIYEIQAELCRTMSNAIRLEIVHALREGPKRVNDLAHATGQPQATISRHLSVLRNGGIVTSQRHAQDVIYQIANPKIVSICDLMREVLAEEAIRRSILVKGFTDEHSG